jgi:phage tail-like protein
MPLIPTNAAFGAANGLFGGRQDPYLPFNFLVEIDGLLTGGFQRVSGLESQIEVKEYAEGGVNGYLHQLPGTTRYPHLVLTHGLTNVETLWNWYDGVSRGVVVRRNLTIYLLDAQRTPAMWWDVKDALPIKWSGPTFDAGGSAEVAVESLELAHRGITKPALGRALSAARGVASLFS